MGRAIDPDAGFTLIELLIAVAVMAVLAVGASLTALGGAREDSDLARFRTQFDTARMLAITGQQSRGLTITARGMRPAEHGADGWSPAGRETRWRGRVALSVPQTARMGGTGTPDLVFLSNGQTTPFRLGFSDGGRVVNCRSDGWTGLTCDGG